MQVIIIAAGRGQRLMPTTADAPKCFAEVAGRRLLDWALDAFRANGLDRIGLIGGYQIDRIRESYPDLTIRENAQWPHNNILASLFCAEDLMGSESGFLCCYSDILFTADVVARLKASPADMALGVDTEWLVRYEHRTDHPPDDAEKITSSDRRVARIDRRIAPDEAYGEYIGVAKFSREGARRLRDHYHRCRALHAGRPWRGAASFEKAYKILLFQEMIENGESFAHVDTPGGYVEVDTQQDYDYARSHWVRRHLGRSP
ncbi:MAG: phosphocholine cytidylyltransferase family protein [Planctomycetes bacterium]|nr:phosphocholine cytidylyltransferase family protein [Planctomycetota bacterium]